MSYDIVVFRMCTSNEHFEAEVTGSKGSVYRVTFGQLTWEEKNKQGYECGWRCSCKAFQFRGICKHITKVRPFRCGYHEQWGTGKSAPAADPDVKVLTPPDASESPLGTCPCCGGAVVAVRCAV